MATNASADIGDIGTLRRAIGLTQQALAHRAACSIGMVRMLEAGAMPHRSQVLPRVIAALTDVEVPDKDLDGKARDDGSQGSG